MDSLELEFNELENLHRVIGKNVAQKRKELGVTQLELALSIGYNGTSVIAKAEAGTEGRHFSIEQLYKISEAFEVDISEFFKGVSRRKHFKQNSQ